MQIKINKEWCIKDEGNNFVLYNNDEAVGYYSSFFSALDSYPNYRVKFSSATSVGKLLDVMKEIKEEIDNMKDQLDTLQRESDRQQQGEKNGNQ